MGKILGGIWGEEKHDQNILHGNLSAKHQARRYTAVTSTQEVEAAEL